MTAQYYHAGVSPYDNVYRVTTDRGHEYLDHSTAKWVASPRVIDAVSGMRGDAETHLITLKQAKAVIKRRAPNIEPEWRPEPAHIGAII